MTCMQSRTALAFAENQEYENSVNGDESAVMNNEKWNHKKLAKMKYRVLHFGKGDFEDVVKADYEVFRPVEQNDVEGVPAKDDLAVNGRHIGQYQD